MKKLMALILFAALMTVSAAAFAAQALPSRETPVQIGEEQAESKADAGQEQAEPDGVKRWILINIPARSLRLYSGDKCVALYPVGVGKAVSKTPQGYYKIIEKAVNPTWVDPGDTSISIASGPDNPLGYRWMGIGGTYGIHGTNNPSSVGHYVSNGCVRMVEANVEELFSKVEVGDEVQIIYNRLVIDKTPDNRIAYYIYPDGYDMQKLTVDFVRQGLNGYGVGDFVTNEQIQKEIDASSGRANYVASPVNVFKGGAKLGFKAVNYQNLIYVPVRNLADLYSAVIKIDGSTVSTAKGAVPFYNFNGKGYIRLTDISKLFDAGYILNANITEVALTDPAVLQEDVTKQAEKAAAPVKDADVKQDKAAKDGKAAAKAKTKKADAVSSSAKAAPAK